MNAKALLIAILLAASTAAEAQSMNQKLEALMASRVGTTAVSAEPQFANGQLSACTIEFNSLVRDHKYRQGGFSKVFGSFGVHVTSGVAAVVPKVVVHDIDARSMAFVPQAPANAYFVTGYGTSRDQLIAKHASDTPGGLFSIFRTEVFPSMMEAISQGKITLAFNRTNDGSDVPVSLNLRVLDTDEQGRKTLPTRPI